MLKNKIALVTGGARGIGRAISLNLVKNGAKVAVNYCKSKEAAVNLADEVKEWGEELLIHQANIVDPLQVTNLISKIVDTWGGLDILVNCAGIMKDNYIEDISLGEWDEVLNVNLRGAFLCAKAAVPIMKARKGGRIINISSQAAFTGSEKHLHYVASKAGILGLTYSLAKELGKYNITVNAISPGRIMTDMIKERMEGRKQEWLSKTPLKRFGTPEEVAESVVFLASEKASYITGANLHVNGGILMG